jgi:hypothetical protein
MAEFAKERGLDCIQAPKLDAVSLNAFLRTQEGRKGIRDEKLQAVVWTAGSEADVWPGHRGHALWSALSKAAVEGRAGQARPYERRECGAGTLRLSRSEREVEPKRKEQTASAEHDRTHYLQRASA